MTTTTFNLDTDDPTLAGLLSALAVDPGNHDLMRVIADRLEELVSVSDEAAWLAMACRYAAENDGWPAFKRWFDKGEVWIWNGSLQYTPIEFDEEDPYGSLLDAFRRLSIAMKRAGVTA